MVTVRTGRKRSLQSLEAPLYGHRASALHLRPVAAHASACGLFSVSCMHQLSPCCVPQLMSLWPGLLVMHLLGCPFWCRFQPLTKQACAPGSSQCLLESGLAYACHYCPPLDHGGRRAWSRRQGSYLVRKQRTKPGSSSLFHVSQRQAEVSFLDHSSSTLSDCVVSKERCQLQVVLSLSSLF